MANEDLTKTGKDAITTVEPSSRDSLPIAFRMWARRINLNLNVCMPCIVEAFDRNTHQAIVRPLPKAMSIDTGERFERASYRASVWRWQVGGFLLDSPIFNGETGWLISSDRDASIVKGENSKILSSESYKNENDANKGPGNVPDGSEETHVFDTGFFIPDKWGEVEFQEEYKNALIIRQQNTDGSSNGEAVFQPDGEVKLISHPQSSDETSSTESSVSIKGDVITIDRKELSHDKERLETKVVEEDKVTFCTDGIIYDGVPDRTEDVVVGVRYNAETLKLQTKVIKHDIRGDFIVGVGNSKEAEWVDTKGDAIKGLDAKVDVSTADIPGGTEVTLTPNNGGTPDSFVVMNGSDGHSVDGVEIADPPGIKRNQEVVGGTVTKTVTPIQFKVNGEVIPDVVNVEAMDGVGISHIAPEDIYQDDGYTVTPIKFSLQTPDFAQPNDFTINVRAKNGEGGAVEFDNKSVGPVLDAVVESGQEAPPTGLKNYNKEETQYDSLTALLQKPSEDDTFPATKQRLHVVARMIGDDALHTPGDVQYIKLGTNGELKTLTFDDGTETPPSTKILAEENITIAQKNIVQGPGISITQSGNDIVVANTREETQTVGWTTDEGVPFPVIVALQYYNHLVQVKYGYISLTDGIVKLIQVSGWITITEAVEES